MSKWAKVTVGILGSTLLLMTLLALFLRYFLDLNHYKTNLSDWIQAKTGYTIEFQGPISFQWFPTPGIVLRQIKLSNPASFPQGDAFTLQSLVLGVQLKPLLHKQLVIQRLYFIKPQIHAIKNAQGQWNLLPAPATPSSPSLLSTSSPVSPSDPVSKDTSEVQVDIRQMRIQKGTLLIEDQFLSQRYEARGITFKAPKIAFTIPGKNHPTPLLSLLYSLSVNTTLTIQTLQGNTFSVDHLQAKLVADQGHLLLDPIKYQLWGGVGIGSLGLEVRPDLLLLSFNQTLYDLHASDQTPQLPFASGILNVQTSLTAQGPTFQDLLYDLNGSLTLSVDQGELNHLNLDYELTKLEELVNRQKTGSKRPSRNTTPFNHLENTYAFVHSQAPHSHLRLEAPHFTIEGDGSVNLIDQQKLKPSLDYLLTISPDTQLFPKISQILKNKDIVAITGGTLPIRIVGYLSHPTYTLDPDTLKAILMSDTVKKAMEYLPPSVRQKLDASLMAKIQKYNSKMNQ